MKITSDAFLEGELIPTKYTCDGENINPPLIFSDVPDEAVTLALIMDDPDAPAGTWVHWIVWNITSSQKGIEEGEVPKGSMEGGTDFGRPGYGRPVSALGHASLFFKLSALDTKLALPKESTKKILRRQWRGTSLSKQNSWVFMREDKIKEFQNIIRGSMKRIGEISRGERRATPTRSLCPRSCSSRPKCPECS